MADQKKYLYIYSADKSEPKCRARADNRVGVFDPEANKVIATIFGGKYETENVKIASRMKKLGFEMLKVLLEDEESEEESEEKEGEQEVK